MEIGVQSVNRPWKFAACAGALMCAGLLAACGGDETGKPVAEETSTALQPDSLADLKGRVAEDAVLPMTRDQFPDTYKKLGAGQFKKANDLTRWAALAAAEHRGICDRVTMINVSGSATRDRMVWYADCGNGGRVNVDQAQAEDIRERIAKEAAK